MISSCTVINLFQSTLPSQGATQILQISSTHIKFQSTLPSQGATLTNLCLKTMAIYFNPRSPHRERHKRKYSRAPEHYFNPRSPHRERLVIRVLLNTVKIFQSTLPSQGATNLQMANSMSNEISIHAPLTGSDECGTFELHVPLNISIHAPLTGSDPL